MEAAPVDLIDALGILGACSMTLIDKDLFDGPPKAYRTTCGLLFSQNLIEYARNEGLRANSVKAMVDQHRRHHDEQHPPYRDVWGTLMMRIHKDPLDGEWVEIECHH